MRPVTELHLHLEGSVRIDSLIRLAALRDHAWGTASRAEMTRRLRFRTFPEFFSVIRDACAVLCSFEALEIAAEELSLFLDRHDVKYAEVYCSPFIFARWGLDYGEVLRALDRGFTRGETAGGARCAILLDTVRQWGPAAACIVLDGFAANRISRVVGFGIGGEESVALGDFSRAYALARELGLRTVAHAGEGGPASDVRNAIDLLNVDRIAHGIRALDDPGLIRELVQRQIPLDIAITSNYRTGVVKGPHPIRRLVDAGVVVTLSTDDPSLFRTNPPHEFRAARRLGALTVAELEKIAADGISVSFADEPVKAALHAELERRLQSPV